MTNRRNFIRTGTAAAAGLAAAGLTPRRIFGQNSSFNRVVYRQLGSTGYKASEIGFGAMNMRDPELVRAAIDSGINYIDTAHSYMNGVNEQVVGQVMKDHRDKVFLTTKLKWNEPDNMPAMMEESLRRLQTDHVDLVLLHVTNKRDTILDNRFMDMFEGFRDKGYTRFIGVSTHSNQAEVLDAAADSKRWEAVLTGYSYASPPEVTAAIERARKAGLAIIGMKNLLNTETRPRTAFGDIRPDKNMDITPTQALLKWVLDDPFVDTTIPGMTAFEHLAEDVGLMGMKMSFDDNETLRRYGEAMKGNYCHGVSGCTGCQDQCPNGVNICELNRCIGYAYGYENVSLAWENYRDLPSGSHIEACSDCDECAVKCVNGINLTETVHTARRLFT